MTASAGLEVDEPLDGRGRRRRSGRARSAASATTGKRTGQLGRRAASRTPQPQLLAEVVAQPGQRAGADQAADVARVAPERRVEGALRARVEAWVAGLARAR